jgi:hypothetical protein
MEMEMQKPAWLVSADEFVMASGGPTREDTWSVNVQIEDVKQGDGSMIDLGTWDKKTGGDLDSTDTVYRPGGMAPPVSLGGPKTSTNITVSRLYRLNRDHQHMARLYRAVGVGRMTVSQQPLDIEGNVFGQPIVWSGRLKTVKTPAVDSEAGGAALIELEMTVEGYPAKSES